jgi:phosphoribosylaminoimidazole-succinocarboxamide synthase
MVLTKVDVEKDDCKIVAVGKVQTHVVPQQRTGKGERLAIYTDGISAGDERLSFGIFKKGKILLWLTVFFKTMFSHIVENDIISDDQEYAIASGGINTNRRRFRNRALLIREVTQIPVECIAREYLTGSLWREYLKKLFFTLGHLLPEGMKEFDKLENVIFTPSIKNKTGHDENITYDHLVEFLREWLAQEENKHFKIDAQVLAQLLRSTTLAIFHAGSRFLDEKGLILADWKGEFGLYIDEKGETIFVWSDEGITPDTARIWLKDSYGPGKIPVGLDKDAVRNWIEAHGGDRNVPFEIQLKTAEAYMSFAEKVLPEEYLDKINIEPTH